MIIYIKASRLGEEMTEGPVSETILVILLSLFTLCVPVLLFLICLIAFQFCCRVFCPKSRIYVPITERDSLVYQQSYGYAYELPPSYTSVDLNKD